MPNKKPNTFEAEAGRIVSAQGPVIDIKFSGRLPDIYEMVETQTIDGTRVILEVAEHLPGNLARCISIHSTQNIQRFALAVPQGSSIRIPVGDALFSRIINTLGHPIDGKKEIVSDKYFPIRKRAAGTRIQQARLKGQSFELIESGIKVIDLLFPLVKGGKTGILGGAALGKSILTLEIIHNIVKKHKGTCVFIGAGERIREGNELYHALAKHDILSKVMMVFGQMNEPPGARYAVAMTGVTMAEHLQSQNKDVLLFIDNVFRFLQAGSEISTLLGRVPSETGYQPTLISEASEFHERIRSTQDVGGSITSFEAVYVPADDLTDPAVVAIFSFLEAIMVLSRERIQLGLYPAIDPLLSSCANLDPDIVGAQHYNTAREVIQVLQKYEDLRRVVLVVGIDELSSADRTLFERARKLQNFLTQPFFVAEAYTGKEGVYVSREQTVAGCRKIIEGRLDHMDEQKFYMIGAAP